MLLQILPPLDFGEDAHLLDGDFVQLLQSLWLWDTVVDHNGVDVLHVGDADKLVDSGIVALVTFQRRMRDLPLLMCHTEQRDIENIGLARIDDVHLRA